MITMSTMSRRIGAAAATLLTAAALLAAPTVAAEPPPVAKPGMSIHTRDGSRCTLGFTLTNREGSALAVTAGHCGHDRVGRVVYDNRARPLGRYVAARSDDMPHRQYGYALIALHPGVRPVAVLTPATAILGAADAHVGEPACIFGKTTGHTCSTIAAASARYGFIADSITDRGDSGGPVIRPTDSAIVGIIIGHHDGANATFYQPVSDVIAQLRADGVGGTNPAPLVHTGRRT